MQQFIQPVLKLGYISCTYNSPAVYVCSNEDCQQPVFICANQHCVCRDNHCDCQKDEIFSAFDSIEDINKRNARYQSVLESIEQIYNDIIEQLSAKRQQFMDFKETFGYGPITQKLINQLNDGNFESVSGKLYVKSKKQINQLKSCQLIYDNQESVNFTKQSVEARIKQIQKELKSYEYVPFKSAINSNIISNFNNEGQARLKRFFNRHVQKFQLIYRASQNSYNVQCFHEKCDGQQDTLVLVQTGFNKIIGGFTPVKWQASEGRGIFTQDSTSESFLFSLSLNQKYEVKDNSKSVCHYKNRGPSFGGGHDLSILDVCNSKNGAYANFPFSYNNGKYTNSQQAWTSFSGQTEGYYFPIKQYQVFKVIWKEQQ